MILGARRGCVLLSLVAIPFWAPPALTAGINLSWNDCSSGVTATTHRTFACNTNAGTNLLTASFDPPPGVDQLIGLNFRFEFQAASNALTDWWHFKSAGSCRLASLSANASFVSGACADPWAGAGIPGISGYLLDYGGDPRRALVAAVVSVGSLLATSVLPGTEYYGINVSINNAKTVGTGSCAGCLEPVCIVLLRILLVQPGGVPGGNVLISNPLIGNFVTWQGQDFGGTGCPGATPVVNRTWGAIKSIYR